jgi:aryl-alcohol dehydrogenase-like predicted oxidoreductase
MKRIQDITGIGLGTAQFAFKDGSREQSLATVRAALASGVRLIDTALAYTRVGEASTAESIVHDALVGYEAADDVLVATKGGHWRDGDRFPIDGSEAALRAHVDISLRVLGVEALDLYQLHHVDPVVPLEQSVAVLEQLRIEGKIVQLGLSNVSREQLDSARRIAPISSVQNRLSFTRMSDLPLAVECADLDIRYLAYLPLDGPSAVIGPGDPRREIATARGVSVQALTLAWLRHLSPAIVPLVGASRPVTIIDSAASAGIALSIQEIEAISSATHAGA